MSVEEFRNSITEVEKAYDHEERALELVAPIKIGTSELNRVSKLLESKKLKYLILRNDVLANGGFQHILPGLNSTHLWKLDLSNNSLGDRHVISVSKALAYNQTLQELVLQQNNFGLDGVKELGELLRQNKNLTALDISLNPIGAKGVTYICNGILSPNSYGEKSKIMKLDLYRCDIGCDDEKDDSAKEAECKEVGWLINQCGTLKELNLSNNGIGVKGAIHIANGLIKSDGSSVSLEVLDLSDNPLTDAGVQVFAMRLVANDSLRVLHLRKVSMQIKGFEAICEYVRQSDFLKTLSIGGNSLPEGTIAAPIIKMLFGDENSNGVTNLKCLDISDTKLGLADVKIIGTRLAERMPCALQELHMAKCNVNDEGAEAIANGIKFNMDLQILDLTGNPFGPEGALSFAETFRRAKELKEFRVTGSRIEAKGQNYLAHALKYNRKLRIKGSSTELDYMWDFTHKKGAFKVNDDGELVDWSHAAWSVVKRGTGAIIGVTLMLLDKDEFVQFKNNVLLKRNKVKQTMFECCIRHSEPSIMETMQFFTAKCGMSLDDVAGSLSGESYDIKEGSYRIIAQRCATDPAVREWAMNKDLILDRYMKGVGTDALINNDFNRFSAKDVLTGDRGKQKGHVDVFVQQYYFRDDFERERDARDQFYELTKEAGPLALRDSILNVREIHDEHDTISFDKSIGSLASTMDSLGACAGYDLVETVSLAQNSARLLSLINSFGRVHGDFRPRNLMLVAREREDIENGVTVIRPNKWVLFDFSKSVRHGERIAVREDCAYMPPEVASVVFHKKRGDKQLPEAHESMDVWAFGVVLYQLLTGVHLFHTDFPNDKLYQTSERAELVNWIGLDKDREALILHRASEGVFFDEASYKRILESAKDLVHWCLQPHPKNRPTFNEILSHPLLQYKREVAYNGAELLFKWYELTGKKRTLKESVQDRTHAHIVNSRPRECVDVQKSLRKLFRQAGCRVSLDDSDTEKDIMAQRDEVRKARCLIVLLTKDALFQTGVIQKLLWAIDNPETCHIIFLDVSTAQTNAEKFEYEAFLEEWKNDKKHSKFDHLLDSLLPYKERVGTTTVGEKVESKKSLRKFLHEDVLQRIEGVYARVMPFRSSLFLAKAMIKEIMERSEFIPIEYIKEYQSKKDTRKVTKDDESVKVLILHNQDSVNTHELAKGALTPAAALRRKMLGAFEKTDIFVVNKSLEDVPTYHNVLAPYFDKDNEGLIAKSPIVVLFVVAEGFLELFKDIVVPVSTARGPVITKFVTCDNYKPTSDELANIGIDFQSLEQLKKGEGIYPLIGKDKNASYEHEACLDNIYEKSRFHLAQKVTAMASDFDTYDRRTTIC